MPTIPDMGRRPHMLCLIPPELADELLIPVCAAFADEPRVAVLVERRGRDADQHATDPTTERHARAPVAEREYLRALPPELRSMAHRLRFVQRLEPVDRTHQDTDTRGLIDAIRAAEPQAASELWWRCAERVHWRLRLRLGEVTAATASQGVLGRILDELVEGDAEPEPLSAWLDGVVDRYAEDVRRAA